jgi:hypothetical protein
MDSFQDPYGILSLMAAKKMIESDDNEDSFELNGFRGGLDIILPKFQLTTIGAKSKVAVKVVFDL